MRITVDRRRCIGAGQCVIVAPEHFDQDDRGVVQLLGDSGFGGTNRVRLAAQRCPSGAIGVSEGSARGSRPAPDWAEGW